MMGHFFLIQSHIQTLLDLPVVVFHRNIGLLYKIQKYMDTKL